jgi:hypothetical protein
LTADRGIILDEALWSAISSAEAKHIASTINAWTSRLWGLVGIERQRRLSSVWTFARYVQHVAGGDIK